MCIEWDLPLLARLGRTAACHDASRAADASAYIVLTDGVMNAAQLDHGESQLVASSADPSRQSWRVTVTGTCPMAAIRPADRILAIHGWFILVASSPLLHRCDWFWIVRLWYMMALDCGTTRMKIKSCTTTS